MITDSECESYISKDSIEVTGTSELELVKIQNRRLKEELNIYKHRVSNLEKENKELKESKCAMQAKVEVEEEFITNSLLRQIEILKKNMENIHGKYDKEEECMIADLKKKLDKLTNDKERLETLVDSTQVENFQKLNRRIQKLESETKIRQKQLDKLRMDKGELQNSLEHEQEALINRLWRSISKAESDRMLISDQIDKFNHDPLRDRRRQFSLQPKDLFQMSINELTEYVSSLQNELAYIQKRSNLLEPDVYQKVINDCNIDDTMHWIRKKISIPSDDSRKSFESGNQEIFKRPLYPSSSRSNSKNMSSDQTDEN